MTDKSDTEIPQERIDDEAYCTEFTQETETPWTAAFLWAFVCPKCGEKNGLEGEPDGFRNKPFRCVECNWVSLLLSEAIDEFVQTEVQ